MVNASFLHHYSYGILIRCETAGGIALHALSAVEEWKNSRQLESEFQRRLLVLVEMSASQELQYD